MKYKLTAIIEKEDDMYISLCPQIDIVSQGFTIEESINNLKEAVELFFEHASSEEIYLRIHENVFVTQIEVAVGQN
jgi:predicted RNase H-like HicB family nuclease